MRFTAESLRTVAFLAGAFAAFLCGLQASAQERDARPALHVHRQLSSGPIGYAPSQIRNAYGFSALQQDGTGETIAIVVAYGSPTIASDIVTFSRQFNLPAASLKIAYPSGRPFGQDGGWALETSLDVEWAHAIAPQAKLLLVVAPSASFSQLMKAVDYAVAQGAAQISMSWGADEFASQTSYDSHFNHPGVAFFAASGDSGTGVIWPSSSPYVTAVGGTTLKLDSSGHVVSETAWADSGGGISVVEARPSYQDGWQNSSHRAVPDVSFVADPNTGVAVYDSTRYSGQKGWFEVGGTSAGTPQIAALMALSNQGRSTLSPKPYANFYTAAGNAPTINSGAYDDISSGCNSATISAMTCAAAGFDEVTGLGSALANTLVPLLHSL